MKDSELLIRGFGVQVPGGAPVLYVLLRLMPHGVAADGWQLLRLILDALFMRELSVAEQRYQAVLAVIAEGGPVREVAGRWGVPAQLARRVALVSPAAVPPAREAKRSGPADQ
jgi:hypothetical protein